MGEPAYTCACRPTRLAATEIGLSVVAVGAGTAVRTRLGPRPVGGLVCRTRRRILELVEVEIGWEGRSGATTIPDPDQILAP